MVILVTGIFWEWNLIREVVIDKITFVICVPLISKLQFAFGNHKHYRFFPEILDRSTQVFSPEQKSKMALRH